MLLKQFLCTKLPIDLIIHNFIHISNLTDIAVYKPELNKVISSDHNRRKTH